jgi:hypothetical protein
MAEILVDMPIRPDMLQSSNIPQMSMKYPQIPQMLMSTECPSERVSRTEFEDVSCRHCPKCPDISCADRVRLSSEEALRTCPTRPNETKSSKEFDGM